MVGILKNNKSEKMENEIAGNDSLKNGAACGQNVANCYGKVLHLVLKKKWFDLIASGDKKTEYRSGKKYWKKRLLDSEGFAVEFDEIHFRNGYRKDAPFMRVEWKGLCTIYGGDWPGDHGEVVNEGDFAIIIGDILEVKANNGQF